MISLFLNYINFYWWKQIITEIKDFNCHAICELNQRDDGRYLYNILNVLPFSNIESP